MGWVSRSRRGYQDSHVWRAWDNHRPPARPKPVETVQFVDPTLQPCRQPRADGCTPIAQNGPFCNLEDMVNCQSGRVQEQDFIWPDCAIGSDPRVATVMSCAATSKAQIHFLAQNLFLLSFDYGVHTWFCLTSRFSTSAPHSSRHLAFVLTIILLRPGRQWSIQCTLHTVTMRQHRHTYFGHQARNTSAVVKSLFANRRFAKAYPQSDAESASGFAASVVILLL